VNIRFAVILALILSPAALAASSAHERQRIFARLPDWTGLWIADDGIMTRLGLTNGPEGPGPGFRDRILGAHPPYNAEWEAKYRAAQTNAANSAPSVECGFYYPGVMESPWVFEVLVTPEETAVIVAGREIRHILTDGRTHPTEDDRWPTPWGDSIGHWEGQTLVIDTVAVSTEGSVRQALWNPMVSGSAHYTERVRKAGKDRLEDQMTIDDPVAFTHPWTVTIPYKRITKLDRLIHGDCMANDRNPIVDGKLTITPAKP
jgi:hypothetical protein